MATRAWRNAQRALARALAIPLILLSCAQPAPDPIVVVPEQMPAPTPPPLPRKIALQDMAGYSPSAMKDIFGLPSLERMEGEMTVLQFTSGICISDMVFNAMRQLIHVEARAKGGTPIEIQPCLDSFHQTLPPAPSRQAMPAS